jgi:hypothetical protein
MRSSYHFLFAGLPKQEKQKLLHSVLLCSGGDTEQDEQRLFAFQAEGIGCSLSTSGDTDETVQVFLREASSLVGVVLFVHVKECSSSSFLMQVELLQALSIPLLAIVVTGLEASGAEFISMSEQNLFHSLRQGGFLHDDLVLLAYTPEEQSETAKRLFQVLSQRVLYATPPRTKDTRPLQLMLRARRRMLAGKEFALATLQQGTISIGDKVRTNTMTSPMRVAGLFDAYDVATPQTSLRADEEPREIFLATDGHWWRSAPTGEMMTRDAMPWTKECRALLYLPTSCAAAIDPRRFSQIELSWDASNKQEVLALYPQSKRLLEPGSFLSATLRDLYGRHFLQQGSFFTWYPPFATQSTKAEGLGRVLSSEAQ